MRRAMPPGPWGATGDIFFEEGSMRVPFRGASSALLPAHPSYSCTTPRAPPRHACMGSEPRRRAHGAQRRRQGLPIGNFVFCLFMFLFFAVPLLKQRSLLRRAYVVFYRGNTFHRMAVSQFHESFSVPGWDTHPQTLSALTDALALTVDLQI
jgi:hypothetical protein